MGMGLGTSHNLSWRGGGRGEIGGPSIFLDGIWGALKCQKMTLGVSSSFFYVASLLSSMMFEY